MAQFQHLVSSLTLDYESQKFFVFDVPKGKTDEFTQQMDGLKGTLMDFNQTGSSDASTKVSVYFMES